jgi:hypothetical protein
LAAGNTCRHNNRLFLDRVGYCLYAKSKPDKEKSAMLLEQVVNFIMKNQPYIFLGVIFLLTIVLMVFIKINMNLASLAQKYETLVKGANGGNLDTALLQNIKDIHQLRENLQKLYDRTAKLEDFEKMTIKKVGIVKFDAFDDISGQLSFALAILNDQKDGFILSNICGRSDSRIYIKPLVAGQTPNNNLTNEEKMAIAQATVLQN